MRFVWITLSILISLSFPAAVRAECSLSNPLCHFVSEGCPHGVPDPPPAECLNDPCGSCCCPSVGAAFDLLFCKDADGVYCQDQRTLNSLRHKDFHKELVVPACHSALPSDAPFCRVTFQKADRKAAKPGKIVRHAPVARAALVLAEGHVKNPMQ